MIIDVLIMANGNNSRFGSKKCLQVTQGKTVLNHIIDAFHKPYTDVEGVIYNIHVITNDKEIINSIEQKPCTVIRPLRRQLHTGTAIDLYLSKALDNDNPKLVIWSDIIITRPKIIKSMVTQFINGDYSMLIPVAIEDNPYVSVRLDEWGVPYGFHFSKIEGYTLNRGYHDQCMFMFNNDDLVKALDELCSQPVTYKHEIDVLNVLPILYRNKKRTAIMKTEGGVVSFNTVLEFANLVKRWGE